MASGRDELDFEIPFYEGLLKEKRDFIDALIPLAEAYTQKGMYKEGLEIDRRLAALLPDDPVVFYNLACSYALTGSPKKALTVLKQSLDLGYDDIQHMLRDPDLKSLHDQEEFFDILRKFSPDETLD